MPNLQKAKGDVYAYLVSKKFEITLKKGDENISPLQNAMLSPLRNYVNFHNFSSQTHILPVQEYVGENEIRDQSNAPLQSRRPNYPKFQNQRRYSRIGLGKEMKLSNFSGLKLEWAMQDINKD